MASLLVLLAALVGAAVRLLPWVLDPSIPWATLAPFARSLLAVAFEAAILGAAIAGFIGMVVANGLPRYYHPVFNAEIFTFAKGGGFYLLVEATDPQFGRDATKAQLRRLGAASVAEVKA